MSLYLNDDLSALDYVQLDYLRELQLERLKKIVRHAYTSPSSAAAWMSAGSRPTASGRWAISANFRLR